MMHYAPRSTPSFIVAALLLATGCGSSVNDGTGGSGGGAGGGGVGGGADVCDDYRTGDDTGAPQPTTVRFVNDTGADLFLGDPISDCGGYLPFSLEKDGVAVGSRLALCEFSCEQIMDGGCACPAACEAPSTIRISAGGSYELSWQGFDYLPTTLPEQCVAEEGCGLACLLPRLATGDYEVTGTAYAAITCSDVGTCDCTPDANGACDVGFAATVDGAPVTVAVSYTYGSNDALVELVFE